MDNDKIIELEDEVQDITNKVEFLSGQVKGQMTALSGFSDDIPADAVNKCFTVITGDIDGFRATIKSITTKLLTFLVAVNMELNDKNLELAEVKQNYDELKVEYDTLLESISKKPKATVTDK